MYKYFKSNIRYIICLFSILSTILLCSCSSNDTESTSSTNHISDVSSETDEITNTPIPTLSPTEKPTTETPAPTLEPPTETPTPTAAPTVETPTPTPVPATEPPTPTAVPATETPTPIVETPIPTFEPEALTSAPAIEASPDILSPSTEITTMPVTVPEDIPNATGNYAVNAKNGKIHIVDECPATGTGDNAMKEPVYFNTYEEAWAYSVQIAPNQEKRQCGNCW